VTEIFQAELFLNLCITEVIPKYGDTGKTTGNLFLRKELKWQSCKWVSLLKV